MPVHLFSFDPASGAYAEGEAIFRRGSVRLVSEGEAAFVFRVGSEPPQEVRLLPQGLADCSCGSMEAPCAHIWASFLSAQSDGSLKRLTQEYSFSMGQQMLAALSRAMPDRESVRLTVVLRVYPDGRLGLGLSMGQDRMYTVKSIPDLLAAYTLGHPFPLSPKLTYQPTHMRFSKDDERLLSTILSHIPSRPLPGSLLEEEVPETPPPSEGRFILLSGAFLQSILRYLENRPFLLLDGTEKLPQSGIRTLQLPLCFLVDLSA